MDSNLGRLKPVQRDMFFDPDEHVVAGAPLIITEIVVQRQLDDVTRLEQFDDLIGPKRAHPSIGRITLIIEVNLQGVTRQADTSDLTAAPLSHRRDVAPVVSTALL